MSCPWAAARRYTRQLGASGPTFLASALRDSKFFTRRRDLPFPLLIAFLLGGLRGAVQAELDAFFACLRGRSRLVRAVSASAFSKARHRLLPHAFDPLNAELLRQVDTQVKAPPTWQGLRVLAADAPKVRLTLLDGEGQRGIKEAMLFGLFRPGIELFEALVLHDPSVGERQALFERLDACSGRDLLVLDRGYPGAWLVAVLLARGSAFLHAVNK